MQDSISITQWTSVRVRPNQRIKLPLVAAILLMLGCSPESQLSGSEGIVATAKPAVAEALASPAQPQEATPAPASEPASQTYAEKLATALEKAAAAKDAVVDQLSSAGESGSQAASDSVTWASEMFNSLKEQGMTRAENTQQWLADDWKLAGAWEYHVTTLKADSDPASVLNELGKERWECFQVISSPGGPSTFYFKRPAKSYLNNLPMKDLMHLLPLMGGSGNGDQ